MQNVLVIAMEAFSSSDGRAFSFTYGFPRTAALIATCVRKWGECNGLTPRILNLDAVVHRVNTRDQKPEDVRSVVSETVRTAISSYDPVLICIVAPYTNMADWAMRVALICRKAKADAVIITGGPHASFLAPAMVSRSDKPFDAILLGPGEGKLKHLLENFDEQAWRFSHPGVSTPALPCGFGEDAKRNSVAPPLIDFSLFRSSDIEPDHGAVVMAGRGCPHTCPFCLESLYCRQDRISFDSVADGVRQELLGLANLGVRVFGCGDSLIDLRHPRFSSFCEQAFSGVSLDEHFFLLTRLHMICADGARSFRRAGGKAVWVGLETANQELLTSMGKGEAIYLTRKQLAIAKNCGLRVGAFFMFGYPGETRQSARETLNFMTSLFQDGVLDYVDCSIFVPYPGLPMFDTPEAYEMSRHELYWNKSSPQWEHWGRYNEPPVFDLDHLTRDQIFEYWTEAIGIKRNYDIRETDKGVHA